MLRLIPPPYPYPYPYPCQDLILGPSWRGCFHLFRSQFGCFHFSVFPLDNVVLVKFGRKNLFWSNVVRDSNPGPMAWQRRMLPFRITVRGRKLSPVILDRWLFFFQPTFFSPTDKKKVLKFLFLPKGPRGFFPASAGFRCCIAGSSGHSGHVRFWQGKFSNRHFFLTDKLFFQPTFYLSNRQKTFFFQMTNFFSFFPPL